MATTIERLREVVEGSLDFKEEVNKDTLISSFEMDSLDSAEFIIELEEEFDVSIPDNAFITWKNVGDIIKYLEDNFCNKLPT